MTKSFKYIRNLLNYMVIVYKDDFSVTAIIYLIKILKIEQKSNELNHKSGLAKDLNVNQKSPLFREILDVLYVEGCLTYKEIGRDKYLVFDLNQLRGTINNQKNIEEFKYFFKKEV